MKRLAIFLLGCCLIAVIAQISLGSRILSLWSLEKIGELASKSDVIAIGRPLETRLLGCTTSIWQGSVEMYFAETLFDVQFLKAPPDEPSQLLLVHFVEPRRLLDVDSFPDQAFFTTNQFHVSISNAFGRVICDVTPEYLLFLHKRKDGRFDPAMGHVDSSDSIRLLLPQVELHERMMRSLKQMAPINEDVRQPGKRENGEIGSSIRGGCQETKSPSVPSRSKKSSGGI